jgi:hypothetical protein
MDLLRDLGGTPTAKDAAAFRGARPADRNRLRTALVAAWLLHDPWFRERPIPRARRSKLAAAALRLLASGLDEVAALVQAKEFTTDPDRREELARLCLAALGLRPAGETAAQAEDRLRTFSSVERARVLREARAAEERARQVREAMASQAAEESSPSYSSS